MSTESLPQQTAKRRLRWPVAVGILVAGGALVGVLQLPELFKTDAERYLASMGASLLTAGGLTFWAIFLTGFDWPTRRRLMLACAGLLAALILFVRIDELSGNMIPRLAWRWSAKPDQTLVEHLRRSERSDDAAAVDLASTSPHDFPQFLGENRDGRLSGPKLAQDWQANPPKPIWRQPIGAGWSAFAVVGDFAVTQEQRGSQELVTCYEARTGRLRWSHADETRYSSTIAGDGPRATPTVDRGRVYALGASGNFVCLDGATGNVLWRHDLVAEHHAPLPQWGISCSPLVVADRVIVSAGGPNGHSLVAYDCETGEVAWHAGDRPASYASPILATLVDTPQILVVNQDSVGGHAPDDGRLLWTFAWPGGEPKVSNPVTIAPDRVFIAAGYGLGCKLLQLHQSDGGAISVEKPLWENRLLKPKFTNVVLRDDAVYGLDDGRALVCLSLADGKRRWRGGRYGHGQLLLVDDLLLVQSEAGEVALVEATPERYHELTRFQALEGKTWNTPALAGRLLLVRNATEAACFELPVGGVD